MNDILARIFAPPPAHAFASLDEFWRRSLEASTGIEHTARAAMAGGAVADRLGYAFAAGYHAALRRLVPSLGPDHRACLAATEEGGGHPRAIATRLDACRLHGTKTFATLATEADVVLVVAKTGDDDRGRPMLRVVRVTPPREGLTIAARAPFPVAPEIPHAKITFDGVAVSEDDVLPGDGYDRYLKPFRTIEDVHVLAALLAYVGVPARRHAWPREVFEELAALLVAVHGLSDLDPSARETHVALGGVFARVKHVLVSTEPHWAAAGEQARARWERDKGLLAVADNARRARLEAAWKDR
jgi:acyl-CoA dehydrogenase